MRHNFLRLFFLLVPTILILAAFGGLPACSQSDPKACRKPPKILSQPKPPEYRDNGKKRKAQGKDAITIDEDGHVSEAKVLEALPKEAADALLVTAKTITFEPRPGAAHSKPRSFSLWIDRINLDVVKTW